MGRYLVLLSPGGVFLRAVPAQATSLSPRPSSSYFIAVLIASSRAVLAPLPFLVSLRFDSETRLVGQENSGPDIIASAYSPRGPLFLLPAHEELTPIRFSIVTFFLCTWLINHPLFPITSANIAFFILTLCLFFLTMLLFILPKMISSAPTLVSLAPQSFAHTPNDLSTLTRLFAYTHGSMDFLVPLKPFTLYLGALASPRLLLPSHVLCPVFSTSIGPPSSPYPMLPLLPRFPFTPPPSLLRSLATDASCFGNSPEDTMVRPV